LDCREKLVDGEAGGTDKASERSSRSFLLVGNGQGGHVAFADQDDVAATSARFLPAESPKYSDDLSAAESG